MRLPLAHLRVLRVCSSSQPAAPAGKAAFTNREHPEDGVLMNSSAYANKCRECAKTIDAGSACWCGPRTHATPCALPCGPHTPFLAFRRFDKAGEPGRKTTCTACHDVKAPPVSPEDEDPNVATVKKATKKRKLVAKARRRPTPSHRPRHRRRHRRRRRRHPHPPPPPPPS